MFHVKHYIVVHSEFSANYIANAIYLALEGECLHQQEKPRDARRLPY